MEDPKRRKIFLNYLNDLLPFVEKVSVAKFLDKSLLFKLKESYYNEYLPASLLSEGTVNITALLIAIFFENNSITIIEEPEKNIHPKLISKIVNIIKDASKHNQIIITTHNPEFIKHCDLKDLLLITRDSRGFSRIVKPADSESVRTFLENEIGIEELYVRDLLENP